MKAKKDVEPEVKRANLSFLQLIFPSFLLVILPIAFQKVTLMLIVLEILVFGYQYFLVQQFVNSMYT